jgi:hypothetical protein
MLEGHMRRLALSLVAVALLGGALAGPVAGGTGTMVGGVPIVGPEANALCADLIPYPGSHPGYGTMSYFTGTTGVSGSVMLRGAAPNTAYEVRLIQASASWIGDCHVVDGLLHTDAAGSGFMTAREARVPYATVFGIYLFDPIGGSAFIGIMPMPMTAFGAGPAPFPTGAGRASSASLRR